jgi:hypothetical protein
MNHINEAWTEPSGMGKGLDAPREPRSPKRSRHIIQTVDRQVRGLLTGKGATTRGVVV